MTDEQNGKSIELDSHKWREQCGPPPVLSTESVEAYYEMMSQFVEVFTPKNVLEQSFIKDLTDATWEAKRYSRYKALLIERKFQQRLEFQAERMKLQAERNEAFARKVAEKPANELARMDGLAEVLESSVQEIDNILKRTPDELDHARALEDGFKIYEGIDDLLNHALARRNDALRQLEWYREGLGKRLHKVSDEIIEAEYTDVGTQASNVAAPPTQPGPETPQ